MSPRELAAVQCRLKTFTDAAKKDRANIIKSIHKDLIEAMPDQYTSNDSKALMKVKIFYSIRKKSRSLSELGRGFTAGFTTASKGQSTKLPLESRRSRNGPQRGSWHRFDRSL